MSGAGSGTGRRAADGRAGWRALGWFWALLLLALGVGWLALQRLGPPEPSGSRPAAPADDAAVATGHPAPPVARPATPAGSPAAPPAASPVGRPAAAPASRAAVQPIAPPDPALAERASGFPGRTLPRIGADGQAPMQAYAAAFDAANPLPRVGLIVAGIGLDPAASAQAIATLPPAVTLAVSPYAADPAPMLAAARQAGHEYLLSLPMEPQSYPLNDPGPHALLTSATARENRHELDWALSRFSGYVGVTGALGPGLRGERFAASAEDMAPVLRDLTRRGLLYVDPRPGAAAPKSVTGRSVDVVIDQPADAAAIDAALARLDRIAARDGSAVGLVSAPLPVTLARLAEWSHRLKAADLVLAPVSALVAMPRPRAVSAGPAQSRASAAPGASRPVATPSAATFVAAHPPVAPHLVLPVSAAKFPAETAK